MNKEIILCTTCGLPLDRNHAENGNYCKCPFEINEIQLRNIRNEAHKNITHCFEANYVYSIENSLPSNLNNKSLNK